jgi:hypothetical protein
MRAAVFAALLKMDGQLYDARKSASTTMIYNDSKVLLRGQEKLPQ